jgi:hypothetical protein
MTEQSNPSLCLPAKRKLPSQSKQISQQICQLQAARMTRQLTESEFIILEALLKVRDFKKTLKTAQRRIIKAYLTSLPNNATVSTPAPELRPFEPPIGEEASQDPHAAFAPFSQEVDDMSNIAAHPAAVDDTSSDRQQKTNV